MTPEREKEIRNFASAVEQASQAGLLTVYEDKVNKSVMELLEEIDSLRAFAVHMWHEVGGTETSWEEIKKRANL